MSHQHRRKKKAFDGHHGTEPKNIKVALSPKNRQNIPIKPI